MKVKKIIIFTTEPFPIGMAATNRIISYAKGFIFHGIDVEVVCLRRRETAKGKIHNINIKGNYQGINFLYLSKSTIKSKNFFYRRIHIILSYFSIFSYSLKHIDKNTGSIYYGTKTTPAIILSLISKIKNGVLLKDESEHPDVRNKGIYSKYFFKNIHFKLFDGYLLITKNLISYFNSLTKTPTLHVPMTVELDRFDDKAKNRESKNSIVYTGFLNDQKDGISILIKAFAQVVKGNNSHELFFYGPMQSQIQMDKYFDLIKNLEISHLVHFKGRINRSDITKKLLNAKILVLPRPDSLQAQNGFPTKLGEYLATGNPTLVTSVGEIPDYLTDNLDSYIAKPGDVLSLKNKLLEIVEDYSKARKVGLNGRRIAEKFFNNKIQTKKIIEFLENINN